MMTLTKDTTNSLRNPSDASALTHFVSTEYLSTSVVYQLIDRALELKALPQSAYPKIPGRWISNVFLEPSTRTHLSFQVAERHLGLEVVEFDPSTSSLKKGETLFDTVLTLQALGVESVVIRSQEEQYYEELIASPELTVSIINGGDGSGQHPSQCLLDVVTIYEEFGHFDGLNIAICGDLLHSRVARSNAELLHRLGANLYFCGPKNWYASDFDQYGTYTAIDEVIEELDVVMLLRVQHERHDDMEQTAIEAGYHELFGLTLERASRLQPEAIIMHPAPVNRGVEIADELVNCAQSRIYRQMQNGVFTRMAILEAIHAGKS